MGSGPFPAVRPRLSPAALGSPCPDPGQHLPVAGSGVGSSGRAQISSSPGEEDGADTEGRNVLVGRSPRLRQLRALPEGSGNSRRGETSPTVITRQINGRIPDGRVPPIHGSSTPSQGSSGRISPAFRDHRSKPLITVTELAHALALNTGD